MVARRILAGSFLLGGLILASGAAAKDFKPGDLSICNAKGCVAIKKQAALDAFATFYDQSRQPPARVGAPRLGVPFFRLEFSNHYVTGIVATTRLDRFLSYGVNLDQFRKGVWYRVPRRAVVELRRLTAGLKPLRLTAASLRLAH